LDYQHTLKKNEGQEEKLVLFQWKVGRHEEREEKEI
jgi:hypothetical protein